jgi:hypothetical protein
MVENVQSRVVRIRILADLMKGAPLAAVFALW